MPELGQPDPQQAGDGEQLCHAWSDLVAGMRAPFVCTRAAGHTDRGVAEHAAAAPYESRLPIVVAAWTDGSAPRVYEPVR